MRIVCCREFRWWDGLTVNIPVPVEEVLTAIYGENYKVPVSDWVWDVSPFNTGYCQPEH